MKNIIYYITACVLMIGICSCKKNYDNFAEPTETLTGTIFDSGTKQAMQTEAGGGGVGIRLEDISYSANPSPYVTWSKQDGTYANTKLFSGTYRITPEGPFEPYLQRDGSGTITVDLRDTVDIKGGTTKLDFQVVPYLRIKWIGEPVINADNTITVQVQFDRGSHNQPFASKNISDVFLFVSETPYVGNNNKDDDYSTQINYGNIDASNNIGKVVTITSSKKRTILGNRPYFIRVGVRLDYDLKRYNYTDIKKVQLP